MGVFSWCDCITKTPIMLGERKSVYVLIPKEYGGGHIEEKCYQGYGVFGSYDIYELIAEWNRGLFKDFRKLHKPFTRDRFMGLYEFEKEELRKEGLSEKEISRRDQEAIKNNYQRSLDNYYYSKSVFDDFMKGLCEAEMLAKYPYYERRDIGIALAGEDKNNFKIKFPIKISFDKDAVYEDCEPSLIARNQGCF